MKGISFWLIVTIKTCVVLGKTVWRWMDGI